MCYITQFSFIFILLSLRELSTDPYKRGDFFKIYKLKKMYKPPLWLFITIYFKILIHSSSFCEGYVFRVKSCYLAVLLSLQTISLKILEFPFHITRSFIFISIKLLNNGHAISPLLHVFYVM